MKDDDLDKQIEEAQATLKQASMDVTDPYDWVYIRAFKDKIDRMIARRDDPSSAPQFDEEEERERAQEAQAAAREASQRVHDGRLTDRLMREKLEDQERARQAEECERKRLEKQASEYHRLMREIRERQAGEFERKRLEKQATRLMRERLEREASGGGFFGKQIVRCLSAEADNTDLAPEVIDFFLDLDSGSFNLNDLKRLTPEEADYIIAMLDKYPVLSDDPSKALALLRRALLRPC